METRETNVTVLKHYVDMQKIKDTKEDKIELTCSISRSGIPCLYECGGAFTNLTSAQLVTDKHGNKKTALKVFTKGDLCNKNHAAVPIEVDDLVFQAWGKCRDDIIQVLVYKVTSIDKDGDVVIAKLELTDFDNNILPFLAITHKCSIYHCRFPVYIKEKQNNKTNQ